MITGRQSVLPAGGRATFRSKSLVLLGTLLILSSMFAYVAARPGSVLAVGGTDLVITSGSPAPHTADELFDVTVEVQAGGEVVDTETNHVTLTISGALPTQMSAEPSKLMPKAAWQPSRVWLFEPLAPTTF